MRMLVVFVAAIAALIATESVTALQSVPTVRFDSVDREFYIARSREELAERKALMERLKTAPLDDASLRDELERRYNELAPAYLYHLAERTFPIDRKAAVEWYWLGHLRARLDAVLCSDTTAVQGVRYLPGAAPSVAAYLRANPKQAGEIGLRVLARDDLRDSKASPQWICSHGVRSMNRAVQSQLRKSMSKAERDELGLPNMDEKPQPTLAWLISEEKMAEMYPKVLDGSRRMFGKLMEPTDEKVEWTGLAVQPQAILTDRNIKNALWSGSDRILFAEMIPREPWNLLQWDGTRIETLANDLDMGICVADDFISYRTRAPRLPEGTPRPIYNPSAPKKIRFKAGVTGAFEPQTIEYTERALGPGGFQRPEFGRPTFSRMRQSSLTCEWRHMGDLSQGGDYSRMTADLGDGRGFLASYSGREDVDGGTFYFRTLNAQPVKISEDAYPVRCMKDLSFSNAVQMVACPVAVYSVRGKETTRSRAKVALLKFDEPIPFIETQPFALIPGERGLTQTLVTKRGIIRVMPSRNTPAGPKPGGLYWYDGNTPKKIWEGFAGLADVSDNGCKLVFTEFTNRGGNYMVKDNQTAFVLDVCAALPTRE